MYAHMDVYVHVCMCVLMYVYVCMYALHDVHHILHPVISKYLDIRSLLRKVVLFPAATKKPFS